MAERGAVALSAIDTSDMACQMIGELYMPS